MEDEICPHCKESYENRIYDVIEDSSGKYIVCPECEELIQIA